MPDMWYTINLSWGQFVTGLCSLYSPNTYLPPQPDQFTSLVPMHSVLILYFQTLLILYPLFGIQSYCLSSPPTFRLKSISYGLHEILPFFPWTPILTSPFSKISSFSLFALPISYTFATFSGRGWAIEEIGMSTIRPGSEYRPYLFGLDCISLVTLFHFFSCKMMRVTILWQIIMRTRWDNPCTLVLLSDK